MILPIQKCFAIGKQLIEFNIFFFKCIADFNFGGIHIGGILDLVIVEWLITDEVFWVLIILLLAVNTNVLHVDILPNAETLTIEGAQVGKGCFYGWSVRLGPAARVAVFTSKLL